MRARIHRRNEVLSKHLRDGKETLPRGGPTSTKLVEIRGAKLGFERKRGEQDRRGEAKNVHGVESRFGKEMREIELQKGQTS